MENNSFVSGASKPQYENDADEIAAAIPIIQGLLSYHQRMMLVSRHSERFSMPDIYEGALKTALKVLHRESERISSSLHDSECTPDVQP